MTDGLEWATKAHRLAVQLNDAKKSFREELADQPGVPSKETSEALVAAALAVDNFAHSATPPLNRREAAGRLFGLAFDCHRIAESALDDDPTEPEGRAQILEVLRQIDEANEIIRREGLEGMSEG